MRSTFKSLMADIDRYYDSQILPDSGEEPDVSIPMRLF